MANLVQLSAYLPFLFLLMLYFEEAKSLHCTRRDVYGHQETFECPRLFESRKKKYCCGDILDRRCCEWSDKQEYLFNNDSLKEAFEGTVAVILVIVLIIGGLIACFCCCVCCLLSRKKQQRGRVLSRNGEGTTPGGTSVTAVNYPTNTSYPHQTLYAMQAVATGQNYPPYPLYDQPPPYSYQQQQPPYNPEFNEITK